MELSEEVKMEAQIESAMKSRFSHFQTLADSLTVKGVRRLLEKDLGLETYALDSHKKFVQQCLSECLDQVSNDNDSKTSLETVEENVSTRKGKVEDTNGREQANKDVKESTVQDVEKMEDSPVMGLLTGQNKAKPQAKNTEDIRKGGLPTESIVKDAVRKRASYLKANSSTITMAGVRKLLEEDLELEEKTLLPFKKFINEQVELVLNPPKVSKPKSSVKKASPKSSRGKPTRNESSDESANSLDGESEEDAKPRKKVAARRKVSEESKKRKAPASGTKASSKKHLKEADDNSDAEARGESEDDQSSSDEKPAKRKEIATPSYGKRVEQLKSIIKSCGMSVPPVVYKKAKQVSEDKREAFLRKELEEILSREGLSANPSEKEIKDCKKRKATAKELEGIDMSNIVSSTRRRSTTSFIPPPKPKITVESKDDDAEDGSDEEGDSEDGSDEDNDSQSEEVIEDDDEDNSD